MKFERRDDGSWIAEVPEIPGIMSVRGATEAETRKAVLVAEAARNKPVEPRPSLAGKVTLPVA